MTTFMRSVRRLFAKSVKSNSAIEYSAFGL